MDFSKLCRCCLEEFSGEIPMCSNKAIMEMYLFCIQLNYKFVQGEEVPKYFCLKCRDRIKSAYLFIKYAIRCNERLQNTILQNRATQNPDLYIETTENSKSDIELNIHTMEVYNNTQNSSLQQEGPKLFIDVENYKRLILEQKYQKNCNFPVTNIHSSGIPKNNSEEAKRMMPFIGNTDNNHMTVLFEKQESERLIIPIEAQTSNNNKSETILNSNITTEENYSIFVYNICDESSDSKRCLNQHVKYHTKDGPLICFHCEKTFKTESNLLSHMTIHIKEKREDSVFICDMCDKQFNKRSYLINHLATHSDVTPFKCALCQKRFKRRKSLWGHTKLHQLHQAGEKPYACDVCNKRFTLRGSLNVHAATHSEHRPRPYSCHLCDKAFITKQQLKNHEDAHSGSCPVLCTVCGKSFRNEKCLTGHMRTHLGVKPHACALCDYRAAYISSLRRHEATHTNKRQHQCPHCQKKFNGRTGLVRHIRTHTGEKPIQCPSCPLRFGDHWKRKTHLMRVHKVPFEEIPRLSAEGQPILD